VSPTCAAKAKAKAVARPDHGRMARGGRGLLKISLEPAMTDLSMPCGRATYETALQLFQGCPACRLGGLQPFSTPLDTPRRKPMAPITCLCDQAITSTTQVCPSCKLDRERSGHGRPMDGNLTQRYHSTMALRTRVS
jgi:hypothetical protein